MADFSKEILRSILGTEIDFKSAIDEDLMLRIVANIFANNSYIDGQSTYIFNASANGTPTDVGPNSVLTIDTITQGVFERDDQFNDKHILVTSGTAANSGTDSRFPIIDCDVLGQTFTVGSNQKGENLFEAGMVNNDIFRVMGHVHDGAKDGERIHWDDIIGAAGFERKSHIFEVVVGGGGGSFSEEVFHGLDRTPIEIEVITQIQKGSDFYHYHAHWTASTTSWIYNVTTTNGLGTSLPTLNSNTFDTVADALGRGTAVNDGDAIKIGNVGGTSFTYGASNTSTDVTIKTLMMFS